MKIIWNIDDFFKKGDVMKHLFIIVCIVLMVVIIGCPKKNQTPDVPSKPTGPTIGQINVSYNFTTIATDPDENDIAYQFYWSDGDTSDWSDYVASGESITMSKSWSSANTYSIKARAKDNNGKISEWSQPHSIVITEQVIGGPPTNFTIQSVADTIVRLTWSPPIEGTPDKYIVYFKEVGQPFYIIVAEVTTINYDHNPVGNTGVYFVEAKFGSYTYPSEQRYTIPIYTSTTLLSELNTIGENSGYGWNRTDGHGATYSMSNIANASYVDFYITDFSGGCSLPFYCASPDMGPNDPGGIVPVANWRINDISDPITDPQAPLPKYSIGNYFAWTTLNSYPIYLAIRMPEGSDAYYALIKVDGLNVSNGTVQVESWFQRIKGLRLIKH